jgi:DNA-binding protein YbaB
MMPVDPDQAAADIDAWAQGLAAKADRYRLAGERTEQLRMSATSRDGSVKVTVRADGSVDDLELAGRARSMPLPELSNLILATMHKAQANIADEVSEIMAEEVGDEDPQTRSLMIDNLRARFPDPDEDEYEYEDDDEDDEPEQTTPPASGGAPSAPSTGTPPRRPRRPAAQDDEDEDEGNPW